MLGEDLGGVQREHIPDAVEEFCDSPYDTKVCKYCWLERCTAMGYRRPKCRPRCTRCLSFTHVISQCPPETTPRCFACTLFPERQCLYGHVPLPPVDPTMRFCTSHGICAQCYRQRCTTLGHPHPPCVVRCKKCLAFDHPIELCRRPSMDTICFACQLYPRYTCPYRHLEAAVEPTTLNTILDAYADAYGVSHEIVELVLDYMLVHQNDMTPYKKLCEMDVYCMSFEPFPVVMFPGTNQFVNVRPKDGRYASNGLCLDLWDPTRELHWPEGEPKEEVSCISTIDVPLGCKEYIRLADDRHLVGVACYWEHADTAAPFYVCLWRKDEARLVHCDSAEFWYVPDRDYSGSSLASLPDGRFVVVLPRNCEGGEQSVEVFGVSPEGELAVTAKIPFEAKCGVRQVVALPDGRLVVVPNEANAPVEVWGEQAGKWMCLFRMPVCDVVRVVVLQLKTPTLILMRNLETLVCPTSSENAWPLPISIGNERESITDVCALSNDLLVCSTDESIQVWIWCSQLMIHDCRVMTPKDMQILPDGHLVVRGYEDGLNCDPDTPWSVNKMFVWDHADQTLVSLGNMHCDDHIKGVYPDGSIVTSAEGGLKVWG